jgi:uncharacterized protein HemX
VSDTPELPPEEELPEVPEEKKEPFASTTDIVVILVVAVLAAGFWFWYHGEGGQSRSHFARADSLYAAHRLPQALADYRKLRETEKVFSKLDDSLLYRRIDSLSTLEDNAKNLVDGARAALVSRDTALIRHAVEKLSSDSTGFVPDSVVSRLEKALTAGP